MAALLLLAALGGAQVIFTQPQLRPQMIERVAMALMDAPEPIVFLSPGASNDALAFAEQHERTLGRIRWGEFRFGKAIPVSLSLFDGQWYAQQHE